MRGTGDNVAVVFAVVDGLQELTVLVVEVVGFDDACEGRKKEILVAIACATVLSHPPCLQWSLKVARPVDGSRIMVHFSTERSIMFMERKTAWQACGGRSRDS